jgi:hypothetical protein
VCLLDGRRNLGIRAQPWDRGASLQARVGVKLEKI